jgi:thiol-disulfide isomerase/thioredoxin
MVGAMRNLLLVLGVALGFAATARADSAAPSTAPAGADPAQFASADDLWAHIEKLKEGPQTKAPTREEAVAVFREHLARMSQAADEFTKRYPEDPRRWEAKLIRVQVRVGQEALNGQETDLARVEPELKEIAAAKNAPTDARADARVTLIQLRGRSVNGSSPPADTAALDAEIVAFQKDYPSDPRTDELRMMRVGLNEKNDPEKSEATLRELAKSSNPEVARAAQRQLQARNITKQPLELKFAGLDGKTVDMASLRGKVVLVDFWATWCGPCRVEMPNVIAAYKKYHDKGFEIVGISLDQDKQKMLNYIQQQGMTWPQHFDGKGWHNEISSSLGVTAIPAQWLVDKKGFVRNTNARRDLETQIEKLLAE